VNKLKVTAKWGIRYFLLVISFSVLYKLSFVINPDSFILNNQLNLTPIQDLHEYLWNDKKSEDKAFPLRGLDKLQLDLGKLILKLDLLEKETNTIKKERELLENNINSFFEVNSKAMWENARKYEKKQKELEVYKTEKELAEEIKLLESLAKENAWNISYGVIIANKRVELANVRVITAKKDYETSSYILKNIGSFSDSKIINRIRDLENNLEEIKALQEMSDSKVGEIRNTMYTYLREWTKERADALSFTDFFYYSIGISTTTTFGDITANSSLIRAFVSLQLFLSVFIMGGFVNSVIHEKNSNKAVK